ncbi:IS30 family transposase, partial [Falsihalocynthiibacter sp. S25ZX9]
MQILVKVDNKDSPRVIQALIEQARKLTKELYRSLTWNHGSEMAGYKTFTLATEIDIFSCDPHSPSHRCKQ